MLRSKKPAPKNAPAEVVFEVAYFLGSERRLPSPDQIEQVLGTIEHLTLNRAASGSEERVFDYHNPDSDVSARFVLYAPPSSQEVGLSFEMDLPRATFFALEALPLVVQVARELRLRVKVVEPELPGEPYTPNVEDLMVTWREANQEEVDYLTEQGQEPPYCPADDLEAMWEYMLLRSDLARRYGRRRVEVPPARLLLKRDTGEVYRYAEWFRLEPTVLPHTEYVQLKSPPAPLVDGAIYPINDFLTALKPWFREVPQPIFHRLCEKNTPNPDLIDALKKVKALSGRQFKFLDYCDVVDDG